MLVVKLTQLLTDDSGLLNDEYENYGIHRSIQTAPVLTFCYKTNIVVFICLPSVFSLVSHLWVFFLNYFESVNASIAKKILVSLVSCNMYFSNVKRELWLLINIEYVLWVETVVLLMDYGARRSNCCKDLRKFSLYQNAYALKRYI